MSNTNVRKNLSASGAVFAHNSYTETQEINTMSNNNSQIFADYASLVSANNVQKPIIASFTMENGAVVTWRDRSVIINDRDGDGFTLQNEAACRGALTALIDGFHIAKYKQLEVGLHLFFSEEQLRDSGPKMSVGYLTSAYNGANERLRSIKPEAGVSTLKWFGGSFAVESTVKDAPKTAYNESDFVTKARRVYYKHVAMDMILGGTKICVFPNLLAKVEGSEGTFSWKRSEEREAAFLNGYMKNLTVTPAKAATASAEAAFMRKARHAIGVIDNAVNSGQLEVPTDHTVNLGGNMVTVESLFGQRITKMRGGVRIQTVTVTPANAAAIITEAKNLGLSFILAQ